MNISFLYPVSMMTMFNKLKQYLKILSFRYFKSVVCIDEFLIVNFCPDPL